jgi:hypothetical protein
VGHSLSLLTAAVLLGQAPVSDSRNCDCKTTSRGGRLIAQPVMTESRGWSSGWRSSTPTDTTWRGGSSGGGWVENRPILSRIRSWLGRDDEPAIMQEAMPAAGRGHVVINDVPATQNYRRLPTASEPPLSAPVQRVIPGAVRPAPAVPTAAPAAAPTSDVPLVEVEPISFRPAGQAKGVQPAVATTTAPQRTGVLQERFVNKVGQPGDYSWITGQLEIKGHTYVLHYATPDTVDRYHGSLILYPEGDMSKLRDGDLVSAHGTVVQQPGRPALYRARSVDLVER